MGQSERREPESPGLEAFKADSMSGREGVPGNGTVELVLAVGGVCAGGLGSLLNLCLTASNQGHKRL